LKAFLIALGVLLIGTVAFFLISSKDSVEIPDKLFGRWVTDDPKYADRFFELSQTNVSFGIGDGRRADYTIETIQGALEDNNVIYTITFTDDEGVEYSQSVHFSKSNDDLLIFKNQNGIEWYQQTD
jgi:hypothetical protein